MTLDEKGDVFHSDINVTNRGVEISDLEGKEKFSISVRWNVEGYGYLFMPADPAGEFSNLTQTSESILNLNYELAKTRVYHNKIRVMYFLNQNWELNAEIEHLIALSEELLNDARANENDEEICSKFSQKSLKYSIPVSEMIEIDKARFDITRRSVREDFLFGCDTRGYFQMESKNLFLERFSELFNYGTITHYLKGDFVDFEPNEGKKRYKEREELLNSLRKKNITVEGRPLFWTHTWVTPEWLEKKSYPDLLLYVEKHVKDVISHYGDEIEVWEVVNEMHDWANQVQLNHHKMPI